MGGYGMIFRSRLFLKVFSTIVLLVGIFSIAFYLISVPLVTRTVHTIEEDSANTILDNVYYMVEKMYLDLQSERNAVIESRKRELKNIVLIVLSYIKTVQDQVKQGLITEDEAKEKVLEELRSFRYGNNDYIWVSDYNSVLISHPDPRLHKFDASNLKDIYGNLIVPPMVDIARKEGEGYYSYFWRRLGEERPIEKVSYFKHIPEWKWVIGTGVYIDDIENEISRRKERMIEDLRKELRDIKIARTGYMYIFDSRMNMIIHPNPNIEGKNFASLKDPVTGRSIGRELIEASRTPERVLEYEWDRPDDPGNYT
ncbi:MAG: histidine kinase, partial [Methanobacteriota archaeon]